MRSIFDLTHKRYLFRDEGGWASTYTTQAGTYEPWKMSLGNDMRRQNIEAVMNRSCCCMVTNGHRTRASLAPMAWSPYTRIAFSTGSSDTRLARSIARRNFTHRSEEGP